MSLELIFRLVVFCKTGPWHLPHSFVSFSFTKQFSQWSFRIQACLKTISHNHSHQPTHTAAHTPHSHTSKTCRYPFNLLHTLSPHECLAVGFVYSWVWIILVSEEERGELEGASSGDWLTALSKILQIHANSAKTCPGGYRFDPFDVDVG